MAKRGDLLIMIKLVLSLAVLALGDHTSNDFSEFYFIQQWLPSYCNQKGTSCCYPPTEVHVTDFTIGGLWPCQNDGSALENCPGATFDETVIKPVEDMLRKEWPPFTCPQIGKKYWQHEWNKHGTCAKSVLDEMAYFHVTLNLNNKINIIQALAKAGIQPNNQNYSLESINAAISQATGFHPMVFCNHDAQGNNQIWQVVHCVDKTGTNIINCSNTLKGLGNCYSTIKFPSA
ncbi:ribonuclease 1-like [Chenopodium quinoa]|uniref:Uncharacterized protein n=1 Tax=Chenopodium quinoa TaxID=63459 RepID=A0A803L1R2_CHEQI|nr:ribonuclease 1-like [Chenopodium quinoa]